MTVVSAEKDYDERTITLVAEFAVPIPRVWQLWADPRQLERWWGPPGYPATVMEHDLTPGGTVTYYLTSPEGDRHRGWWRISAVDPPHSLEFVDGFADPQGVPVDDPATSLVRVRLTGYPGGTRMVLHTEFETAENMEQLVSMGAVEGLQAALSQIDELLAAGSDRKGQPA